MINTFKNGNFYIVGERGPESFIFKRFKFNKVKLMVSQIKIEQVYKDKILPSSISKRAIL